MTPALLDKRAAADHLGLTLAALEKRRVRGQFPDPDIRLAGSPGWYDTTLDEWQAAQTKKERQ